MKTQKVLFLITKSNWGGAQRYVFDVATTLDRNRYEPVVALGRRDNTSTTEDTTAQMGVLEQKLTAAGVRTIPLSSLQRDISLLQEFRALLAIDRCIKTERPDVLHLNSSKAGILGACNGRLRRVPRIVFTAHGWAFNEPRPYWQYLSIKFLHWLTVLFAHHTIAVSTAVAAQMDWWWVSHKITVIHPGRSDIDFKKRADARGIIERSILPGRFGLSDFRDDLWVVAIAELHPIKRLDWLIRVWPNVARAVPTARLVIIGDGEERGRLRQLVTTHTLEDRVFFTGHLSNADRLLPAFDCLALPSLSEAYGYVLAEAGLAGLPVVATAVGGVTDIVTHRENGLLFAASDQDALTQQLIELLQNQSLRRRLGREHQRRMRERTVDIMTQATAACYEGSAIDRSAE